MIDFTMAGDFSSLTSTYKHSCKMFMKATAVPHDSILHPLAGMLAENESYSQACTCGPLGWLRPLILFWVEVVGDW